MSEQPAIRKIASDFREGILDGKASDFMCMAVCLPLQGLLTFYGHRATIVYGWADCGDYDMDHVWLALPDGNILDPTADQFPPLKGCGPLPPVYIGPKPDWYHENAQPQ